MYQCLSKSRNNNNKKVFLHKYSLAEVGTSSAAALTLLFYFESINQTTANYLSVTRGVEKKITTLETSKSDH